jgi:ParB/RepB/Spo0J family partition protein
MLYEIPPSSIRIDRATRQRKDVNDSIEEMKISIKARGIINPITVRRTEKGETVLVAGERRLTAALALNLPTVPVRFFENLSHSEAEVIELEENIKRKELHWRDHVKAVGKIHNLYKSEKENWTVDKTANEIGLSPHQIRKILAVYGEIDSKNIIQADGIEQAYNALQRFAERKAESVVSNIIAFGAEAFTAKPQTPPPPVVSVTEKQPNSPPPPQVSPVTQKPPSGPVICADFHKWVKEYSGPKFSFIHCDFPYGNYRGDDSKGSMNAVDTEKFYDNTVSVYWNLLDSLLINLDKVMSYSAHMVFWFNMNFYSETVSKMRKIGLSVHDHPLIWHKTTGGGGLGVTPGSIATHPRRTYDTALLVSRGNRPLVKSMCNSYVAPTVGNKIHPSQKSEPMLRYFFQMFVDETTTVFDPTCGSGASLRAAEDLGAKFVLGLELDPNYAKEANLKTMQARALRKAGQMQVE